MKFVIILLAFTFLSPGIFAQVTQSNFHYQITRDTSIANAHSHLNIELLDGGMEYTTRAEKIYFIRLLWGSDIYQNLEIVDIDSTDLRVRLSDLDDHRKFYFEEIQKLHNKRGSYNRIATFTNHTNDTLYVPTRFGIVYGILEALDKDGNWSPIQYCYNYGYGDHMEAENIYPNQTLAIPFSNEFGDISVKMRMKLHGNDTIYTSNEFDGSIDETAFIIPDPLIERYDWSGLFLDSVIYRDIEKETEYDFTEMKE